MNRFSNQSIVHLCLFFTVCEPQSKDYEEDCR